MNRETLKKAIYRYARKYGYYVSTVRNCTALRLAAIREYESGQSLKKYTR